MRRLTTVGVLAGVVCVVLRTRGMHARLVTGCERMFERMPDTFPPKRMMRGIEDLQRDSARILELLEAGKVKVTEPVAEVAPAGAVHDVA